MSGVKCVIIGYKVLISPLKYPEDIQYEVKPVGVEDLPPPPSYEEVLGQYVTSVQHGQLPSLAYIDIMPRLLNPGNIKERKEPSFQSFDDLVVGANLWLKDNPGLSVGKCESVERKVIAGRSPGFVFIDLESMVQHEATFGFNCFVIGLRLWLTPKMNNQKEVQEIGMTNIFPLEKEVDVLLHFGGYQRQFLYGGMGLGTTQKKTMITYEGLRKSLDAFNSKVKENPIPGAILNVESATLKFAERLKETTIQEAASSAMWFEVDSQSSKRYTQILRVFYVKGKPTTPEICMKEFLPNQLNQPKDGYEPVRYDTFSSVIVDAAAWVQLAIGNPWAKVFFNLFKGIQIANIETRFADVTRIFNEITIDTDSTDQFEFGLGTNSKLRFLRMFYCPNPAIASFQHASVSSRLFAPISLGGYKFETMTQTMTRIDNWMKATGLPIFGVETESFLKEQVSGKSQERCDFDLKPFSAKLWVNAIRVYFPSAFEEPDPNPFPPQLPTAGGQKSSACNIL